MLTNCPVCWTQVSQYHYEHPNGARVLCPVCGTYRLMEEAAQRLYERRAYSSGHVLIPNRRLSAALRERFEQGEEPVLRDPDATERAYTPAADLLEVIDRTLRHIRAKSPGGNSYVPLIGHRDYGVAGAESPEAFDHALDQAEVHGLIERQALDEATYRLTIAGWKHLRELPDVERTELLPLADNAMRVLYDLELKDGYSAQRLMHALGVDESKAARALRYAKKQGWITTNDVFGRQMPVGVSLTQQGMQYAEALLNARPPATPSPGLSVHFHGHNARFNHNSIDASVNVVNNHEAIALLQQIARAVSAGVSDAADKERLLTAVRQIEAAPDAKTRSTRIAELLQIGANFMTILGPFVPQLFQIAQQAQ